MGRGSSNRRKRYANDGLLHEMRLRQAYEDSRRNLVKDIADILIRNREELEERVKDIKERNSGTS